MDTFLNFLVTNWQYISIGLVIVLEVVLFLIKRRSNFVVQDTSIYEFLIQLINEAENRFASGTGDIKKKYVLKRFKERYRNTVDSWVDYYRKAHPFDDTGNEEKMLDNTISYFIENILSTPMKKGGLEREQAIKKKK